MRCLIFGGDGMLGHQLAGYLSRRHRVWVTIRDTCRSQLLPAGPSLKVIDQVDVRDFSRVTQIAATVRPEVVINAVGIIKQREEANDPVASFAVNTIFPHQLQELARLIDFRLIHISTDCVFSGRRGYYNEQDVPDAEDLYGVSKRWGELHEAPAVTLRTSMIGLELKHKRSLIEWFLAQRGVVPVYEKAIFSGLTTLELSRLLERLITEWPDLYGVWHVAAEPISKAELLRRLSVRLDRRGLEFQSDFSMACDRSLDAGKFRNATGYVAPDWDTMLDELARQIDLRNKGGTYHEAA
ncbi:MAG: NAD(P)-dependent oxidoreductase [Pirellulaceae bacterium]|nr:MAG: NAD(P)-dependent oxidoreductase [Pirellulaceae bacterium]